MPVQSPPMHGTESIGGGARAPVTHAVKSWPHLFDATLSGAKRHEMRRRGERDYRVGDFLLLREYDPARALYTGRELLLRVTYVTSAENQCALSGEGLDPDYCVMSVEPADTAAAA